MNIILFILFVFCCRFYFEWVTTYFVLIKKMNKTSAVLISVCLIYNITLGLCAFRCSIFSLCSLRFGFFFKLKVENGSTAEQFLSGFIDRCFKRALAACIPTV